MRWITSLLVVVGGCLSPAVLEAAVNLSLQPQANPVQVGQTVRIDLIAANTLGTPQEVAAVDAIVQWDPAVLQLLGYTNPTPDPWMFHGFLPDPCGLNDVLADGEALYTALAPPPPHSAVVPAFGSIVVTTFEFTALQTATGTPIDLVIQQADCTTRVFAPSPPQTYLLGAAAGTAIDIVDVLPLGRLALEADFCQLDAFPGWPGDQIVIQLHMRNLQQPVTGFQAFLEYDHDRLAYCGSLSAYTASPFGVHVQPVLTAEVSPGRLRLDGSTFGPGTSSEAMLAALVFTVYPVGECTICCSVVFDLNQPFPSELSYQGVPVPTALSNSAVVFLDGDGPVFTDHPDSLEVCAGGDAVFTATATDNCGAVGYQWQKYNQDLGTWENLPDAAGPTLVLSPAQASDAGLYRAVATDECHAAYSDPAVLVVRALPPCDIDVAEGVCAGVGGYVAAVPDAGDEAAYAWTIEGGQIESGQGTPTIVFISGGVGTLLIGVSITDRHGCSCEGTREITVYANPVAAAGNTGPVCDGQAVSLLGGPAGMAAYEWIGPGDFSSNEQNPVVVPAVPGEYCLTVTDDHGCTSTACTNVEVFANPTPVITATPGEIVCEGTPVLLDAGAGYASYLWSTGAATQTIVVAASGTYSVTVSDDHGCSGTDDIRITAAATANVEVEAELVGVHLAGVQRCIHFSVDDCSAVGDHVLTFLDHDGDDADGDGYQDPGQTLPATPVRFVGTVAVPCGDWTLLCAKDEQHTLFASTTLTDHGTHFTANSLLSLIGGDTDNDSDVDIHDVTFFMAVYGGPAVAGGCPWAGGRDADFSNDGTINAVDWTFLTAGWLTWAPCGCWGMDGTAPDKIPAGQAVVAATAVPAWVAARADLNHDGLLDYRDVRTFERRHGLGNALSTALGQAGGAQPASAPQTKALPQSGGLLGI